MAKQNVFNFKTMQFELVECDDLLSLIDYLNAECAAQQSVQLTGGTCAACGEGNVVYDGCCINCGVPATSN